MNIRAIIQRIRQSHQAGLFLLDIIMLMILIANLSWLMFDNLFKSEWIQSLIQNFSPSFYQHYRDQVHPNFILYDHLFLLIYLTELLTRWAIAIKQKTYHRWFFYPFVHWYDVLGCIPMEPFRWLRLLRVGAIVYRLHKYQIIDFSQTYLYSVYKKYSAILIEELSDRIVVHVLEGVREELKSGGPVLHRISAQVIEPHKQDILDWVSNKISEVVQISYTPKKTDMKQYFRDVFDEATLKNPDFLLLQKVPMMGEAFIDMIQRIVVDLVYHITDRLIDDLDKSRQYPVMADIADVLTTAMTEEDSELNAIIVSMMGQAIDVLIEQAKIQQWKLSYVS